MLLEAIACLSRVSHQLSQAQGGTVIHHAIRVNDPIVFLAGFKQRLFEGFATAFRCKYSQTIIASVQHVVHPTRMFYSQTSRQDIMINSALNGCNIKHRNLTLFYFAPTGDFSDNPHSNIVIRSVQMGQ